MNLDDYPGVRKALYIAQWVVNLALGITAIILTSQGQSPEWFVITGAVFNFIWTYTGTVASKNVSNGNEGGNGPLPENGDANVVLVLLIGIAIAVLLIFLVVFNVITPGR